MTWAHELRSADRLEVDLGVGEAGLRAGIGAGIEPGNGAGIGATAATVRRTIGAPTPTDEPCTLPARLVGTFPVDDTRRRLSSGPLTDHLLRRAVGCYLDLVAATPPDERWALIPTGGFPAGDVDATLRAGVLDGFATTPLLRSAVGDEVTAADAVVLPELSAAGAALIGQAVPGLLAPPPAAAMDALRAAGVRSITVAAASSALAGIDRPPAFWRQVYAELATMDRPPDPEDLADLPVPLVGGRRALGARGCLMPLTSPFDAGSRATGGADGESLAVARVAHVAPDLRIIEPAAAHPLLLRIGATLAEPSAVLADPAVLEAIRTQFRELADTDPDLERLRELGRAVLDLVAAGGRADPVVLAQLVLTDDAGAPWPAGELRMPDAPIAALLADPADLPAVGPEWLEQYPADVLAAVGVRSGLRVLTVAEPDDAEIDLPDLDNWLDVAVIAGPIGEFSAIADLDLIAESRWPQAISLIEQDPAARAALAAETRDGAPTYSTWWLGRHAIVAGRPLRDWRTASAQGLAGLYDPLPLDVDDRLAAGLGVRTDLVATAADDPQDFLERLADPARDVPAARVPQLTAALLAAVSAGADLDLPPGVRTLSGTVVDANDAAVLDAPWLVGVLPIDRLVPGGADAVRVADLLDLPLASQSAEFTVTATDLDGGAPNRLTAAAAAIGVDERDIEVRVVASLTVSTNGGRGEPVRWWGENDRLLATGAADAIGRAVAWAAGNWPARHRCVAAAAGIWQISRRTEWTDIGFRASIRMHRCAGIIDAASELFVQRHRRGRLRAATGRTALP